MLLIADSGSTKTDWALVDETGKSTRFHTIGYNPYFVDSDKIYQSLSDTLLSKIEVLKVNAVFFYGAGCSATEKIAVVNAALAKSFPNAQIEVNHDLLASARALLGTNKGFVAILGTGSNTCIYDGVRIEKNIDSLGYLLGDEGSGSYIGKNVLKKFMRQELPEDLRKKFEQKYNLSNATILDAVYKKPLPNRFLASFCKFADENKDHQYIRTIVKESFDDFFKQLVIKYPSYQTLSFNCVGSVGYVFKDILIEVANSYGMKVGKLIASPIESLVNYHLNSKQN